MLALDFSEATGDPRDEQRPVTSRNRAEVEPRDDGRIRIPSVNHYDVTVGGRRAEFVGAMAARTLVGARRDALEVQ